MSKRRACCAQRARFLASWAPLCRARSGQTREGDGGGRPGRDRGRLKPPGSVGAPGGHGCAGDAFAALAHVLGHPVLANHDGAACEAVDDQGSFPHGDCAQHRVAGVEGEDQSRLVDASRSYPSAFVNDLHADGLVCGPGSPKTGDRHDIINECHGCSPP